jgi:hypothetical protein
MHARSCLLLLARAHSFDRARRAHEPPSAATIAISSIAQVAFSASA